MKRHAIALAIAVAAPAAADTTDRARAGELFDDGRKLMASGDAAGACGRFTEAIQLEPQAAGIMLNLGLCNEAVGKYKTALEWFRKAQVRATETDPPLPGAEKEAREHAAHLVGMVATLRIVAPAGASVSIDGEPVRRDDLARVEIDPGHHAIDATAPGKPAVHQEVDVSGKGGDTVTLAFDSEGGEHQTVVDEHRRNIAMYTAVGGGTLLVASLGLTLYEKHVYNTHETAAQAGDPAALAKTRDASATARDFGSSLAIAGLLAGGVAAYFYFTSTTTAVVPAVTPTSVGIAGRF